MNKYEVSLIGIGSVRYRNIEKIANKPKPKPTLKSIPLNNIDTKNIMVLKIKNVKINLVIMLFYQI